MSAMAVYDYYKHGALVASGTCAEIADFLGLSVVTVMNYRYNPKKGVRMVRVRRKAPAAMLGVGKLTAEQVRGAIERRFGFDVWVPPKRWQAIADELNAALCGGECKVVASSTDGLMTAEPKKWFELSCGHSFMLYGLDAPICCPVCGRIVKR